MTQAPKLFYIDHPITRLNELSDEVCASFTDDQITEYKALYDQYITAQRTAASTGVDLANQLRGLIDALFQDPMDPHETCKQRKYFDRMIRNGETIVDLHSRRYPRPGHVASRIKEARKRFGDLANARVTVGGDETLQEINHAVTYLMSRGMELNVDFTVSNAVGIAKGIAQDALEQSASDNEPGSISGYALMVNDEPVDSASYGVQSHTGYRSYLFLRSLLRPGANDIMLNHYSISFQGSATPTIKVRA